MNNESVNRREWMAGMVAAGIVAREVADATQRMSDKKRLLRFAHFTDVHVQTERNGDRGFLASLRHVQELEDPVEFIMFGGDNLMNVDSREGADKADAQLKTWRECLKSGLSLPYRVCIGNHDILRLDPVDGKKWAMDAFGLDRRYYHFDQQGCRFVVLDSTSPEEGKYKARLDEEQTEWLQRTLAETDALTPVLIVSHIPILAACAYFDGDNEATANWVVPGAWMHLDARRLKDLFRSHPNVRCALSGHIHLIDAVHYNDVAYYCNGAVSGGWWRGPYQECHAGYAIMDVYDDGSVERTYVVYQNHQ